MNFTGISSFSRENAEIEIFPMFQRGPKYTFFISTSMIKEKLNKYFFCSACHDHLVIKSKCARARNTEYASVINKDSTGTMPTILLSLSFECTNIA